MLHWLNRRSALGPNHLHNGITIGFEFNITKAFSRHNTAFREVLIAILQDDKNLLSLLLSILEKMIPIDMAIKGSQCLWELNAFSIEMLDFSKICKCWIESKIPQIQIWIWHLLTPLIFEWRCQKRFWVKIRHHLLISALLSSISECQSFFKMQIRMQRSSV